MQLTLQSFKFWGIIFDSKLALLPCINRLETETMRSVNLLHILEHTSWGASHSSLLTIYRSIYRSDVRSKLYYGSVVYGAAAETNDVIRFRIHPQPYWLVMKKLIKLCKSALNLLSTTSYPLPYSHITSSIKKHLFARWQHLWHNLTSNKLHNIYSSLSISIKHSETQLSCWEQMLYNYLGSYISNQLLPKG